MKRVTNKLDFIKNLKLLWISLLVQWVRICLPMQGTSLLSKIVVDFLPRSNVYLSC